MTNVELEQLLAVCYVLTDRLYERGHDALASTIVDALVLNRLSDRIVHYSVCRYVDERVVAAVGDDAVIVDLLRELATLCDRQWPVDWLTCCDKLKRLLESRFSS